MVTSKALDGRVVQLLIDHLDEINNIREMAQIEAAEHYRNFLLVAGPDYSPESLSMPSAELFLSI